MPSSHHEANDTQGPSGPKPRAAVAARGQPDVLRDHGSSDVRTAETPARHPARVAQALPRHLDGDQVRRASIRPVRPGQPPTSATVARGGALRRPRTRPGRGVPIVTRQDRRPPLALTPTMTSRPVAGAEVELDVLLDVREQVVEVRDEHQPRFEPSARKR